MDGCVKLDDRLMAALRGGAAALPDDLERLVGYLRLVHHLLREKASEHEPDAAMAEIAATEIETLLGLESVVVERVVSVRARDLDAALAKLAVWRALAGGASDEDEGLRDRLVLSLEADLARLARASR
jgi:hypothetical protein